MPSPLRPLASAALVAGAGAVLLLLVNAGALQALLGKGQEDAATWRKVEFSLDGLDADGLYGPRDGKRSLSYEFSIPDTEVCRHEVRAIDATVQFMPHSRGRIAQEGECLCVGSTRQKDCRQVLRDLAHLPYVRRIVACHFE